MKKSITVTAEQSRKLEKIFDCTDRMVRKALTFNSDSLLARKIRMAARKMGCKAQLIVAESECFYDSEGNMIQSFINGASIKLDKTTGKGYVIFNENVVAELDDVKVADIPAIQLRAASL